MDIEKVIKNLSSNNMEAFFVKDKEEAKNLALSFIPEGAVCASGGSVTLLQTGIISELKNGNYKYLDRNDSSLSAEEKEERTRMFIFRAPMRLPRTVNFTMSTAIPTEFPRFYTVMTRL